MAVTPDMAQLIDRLHNHEPTKQAFLADAEQVLSDFDITTHERDAILTRDCDDLVAVGLATNIAALPEVLGCPALVRPTLDRDILDRLRGILDAIRDRVPIPDRLDLPRPFGRRPPVGPPEPRPEPPRPRPTPGPDPPDPEGPGG